MLSANVKDKWVPVGDTGCYFCIIDNGLHNPQNSNDKNGTTTNQNKVLYVFSSIEHSQWLSQRINRLSHHQTPMRNQQHPKLTQLRAQKKRKNGATICIPNAKEHRTSRRGRVCCSAWRAPRISTKSNANEMWCPASRTVHWWNWWWAHWRAPDGVYTFSDKSAEYGETIHL